MYFGVFDHHPHEQQQHHFCVLIILERFVHFYVTILRDHLYVAINSIKWN